MPLSISWRINKIVKFIFLFICSFIASLAEVAGYSFITLFISILILIVIFFLSSKDCLSFIVFSIPNLHVLGVGDISVASLICILYIVKKITNYKFQLQIVGYIVIYLMYCTQYIFRFENLQAGLLQPVKIVIVLVFILLFSNNELNGGRVSNQLLSDLYIFWFGGILAAVIPAFITSGSLSRLSAIENDANILAVEVVFLFALNLIEYIKRRETSGLWFFLSVIISLFLLFATGSRTGYILLFIVVMLSFILNTERWNLYRHFISLIALIVALWFLLSTPIVGHYIDILRNRMASMENAGDLTNGRISLWNLYIEKLNYEPMNWLFGSGSYKELGIWKMPHNMFIQDITTYGIVGTFILYEFYIYIFNQILRISGKQKGSIELLTIIPMGLPIIAGLVLHTLSGIANTFMLFTGILLIIYWAQHSKK